MIPCNPKLFICLCLIFILVFRLGSGQENQPDVLYRQALELLAGDKQRQATQKLARVLKSQPDYFDGQTGSAWYLFGKAVLDLDGKERALRIWRKGLQILDEANITDPFLLEEFIQLAIQLEKSSYYDVLTELFYRLLEKLEPGQQPLLAERICERSLFLLPDYQQVQVQRSFESGSNKGNPGLILLQYWRQQDPTPATVVNERLIEHLQRLQYARQHFTSDHRRGFDDRGVIYARLGKPDSRKSSKLYEIKRIDHRPHEVWFYDSIARGLHFLFVHFEKGRGYESAIVDFQVENFRESVTPDVVSHVLSEVQAVPFVYRATRFLEEDGATRVELALAVQKKDVIVKSVEPLIAQDTLQVRLSVGLEDMNYQQHFSDTQTVAGFTGNDRFDDSIVLVEYSVRTDRDYFFVSGQLETWLKSFGTEWDRPENSGLHTAWQENHSHSESLLRLGKFRTNLLSSLGLEKDSLLMSDIQLAHHIGFDLDKSTPQKGELRVEPNPFHEADRDQPLYLYFEIYGLQLSAAGQANYRIAYEAEVLQPKRNLLAKMASVLGEETSGLISLQSEYTSDQENTHEWIELDLKSLTPGQVQLTVTVTDLVTQYMARRSITFELN